MSVWAPGCETWLLPAQIALTRAPRLQAAFPPYSPQLCMASLRGSRTLFCDPLCYSIWLLFLQHIGTCLRCIFWPALCSYSLSFTFLSFLLWNRIFLNVALGSLELTILLLSTVIIGVHYHV